MTVLGSILVFSLTKKKDRQFLLAKELWTSKYSAYKSITTGLVRCQDLLMMIYKVNAKIKDAESDAQNKDIQLYRLFDMLAVAGEIYRAFGVFINGHPETVIGVAKPEKDKTMKKTPYPYPTEFLAIYGKSEAKDLNMKTNEFGRSLIINILDELGRLSQSARETANSGQLVTQNKNLIPAALKLITEYEGLLQGMDKDPESKEFNDFGEFLKWLKGDGEASRIVEEFSGFKTSAQEELENTPTAVFHIPDI